MTKKASPDSKNGSPLRTGDYVSDIHDILDHLPHRYPFLLVDRILEMEEKKRVVGIKNVTFNEEFFQGHFPGAPVMPGVLILESMAQVGAVMLVRVLEDRAGKLIFITGIDRAKFRRPVRPGDQLRCELVVTKLRSRFCKMQGRATVDGELAAEAEFMSTVVDR